MVSRHSKVAYGSEAAARTAMAENGGDLGSFEQALLASYTDMSQDVAMIRRSREERRQRAARPQG